jgi:heat shock protein HslJ
MKSPKVALPLILLVIACGQKLSPDHGWKEKKWVLTELKGIPVQLSGTEKDAHLILTPGDKKFSGSGGCNRITGTYTLGKKNELHFVNPASTRMACPDLAFETKFLEVLQEVDHFGTDGEFLLLKKGKETIMKLQEF